MTPEDRFERIEQDLEVATRTLRKVVELQELQQHNMASLIGTVDHMGQRLTTTAEAHNRLTDEVAAYVAESRERMKQMEASLDALIRIITAEHSNGKGKL
jgi:CRISPR/Cas system-associated protein Cas10 (large subunit of type III CRISPR-Cas system)